MYPRGHRGFGALLMLVLLLVSGLAVLPWNASAQGNQIVGLVYQCGSPATFIGGATVTLTDANGILAPQTVTTGGDGTFTFSTPTLKPGYYSLAVSKDGYFGNGTTSPLRFDDTTTESRDFCLVPTPTADKTVDLLVVSATSVARTERITFSRTQVSGENVAATWVPSQQTLRVSRPPMSSAGIVIQFQNATASFFLNNGTDYQVTYTSGYASGTIKILNAVVKSNLNNTANQESILVTYSSWTPSARLTYYPVRTGSFVAERNGVAWPTTGNWALDEDTGVVTLQATNFTEGWDILTVDYESVTAVSGAAVSVHNASADEVVRSATTGSSGVASVSLWAGTFELRISATGYAPYVDGAFAVSASGRVRISLQDGVVLTGHARDSQGRFITEGLTGTLYNTNPSVSEGAKIVRASVTGSLYRFNAPAGDYLMVIDADGYKANATPVTLSSGSVLQGSTLALSDPEEYRTEVVYGRSDWGNLTIYRNLTLNADSTLPGLSPAGLRALRLQVDYTLGNGDATIDAGEATDFDAWLEANGPLYVTTDGFLTTNSKSYRSAVSYAVSVQGLLGTGPKVWINTTTTYALRTAPPYVPYGAVKYFVNVTMRPDSNETVYQDYVYVVDLPRKYELVTTTILNGPVDQDGYTRVTLDPGERVGDAQVRGTVELSENGTARAKVTGPSDKFHVVNASYQGYRAYVANNTNLTFSAEDSTDPVGDIRNANFTWKFAANTTEAGLPENIGHGITSYHTYDAPGEYVVNLTVREAGGNLTYRNITAWVDDQLPVARIKTNRTGAGAIANTTLLKVNEDVLVRFDGGLSTDQAYVGTPSGSKAGVIPEGSGYSWDFDGDRITDATTRIVNWSFSKPGTFKVNLTVTDGVGWKSVNATLNVQINDTTAPTPVIEIRDPSQEWALAGTLTETREYSFNGSRTTDNYDKLADLNFTWTVPGPVSGRTGRNHTLYGVNISFTWTEFNTSYKVVLKVTDKGFGSNKPNSANVTRDVTVQVDAPMRPDLRVDVGTMSVSPSEVEEGQRVSVKVNVTNKPGRGTASNVSARLTATSAGSTVTLSEDPIWYNKDGSERTNGTIAAGETVTLVFDVALTGTGNKTLTVTVSDSREPWTQQGGENRGVRQVFVRQAAWVNYAVGAAIVGVIGLAIFGMWVRRRIRAGEWKPRFRREKGEGEAKPKKEVREEKKRL